MLYATKVYLTSRLLCPLDVSLRKLEDDDDDFDKFVDFFIGYESRVLQLKSRLTKLLRRCTEEFIDNIDDEEDIYKFD